MNRCFVCSTSCSQLLMLECFHNACIKCAATNYCLAINNLSQGQYNQRQAKNKKRQNYYCELCLQVTPIDAKTTKELMRWYSTNYEVNRTIEKQKNYDYFNFNEKNIKSKIRETKEKSQRQQYQPKVNKLKERKDQELFMPNEYNQYKRINYPTNQKQKHQKSTQKSRKQSIGSKIINRHSKPKNFDQILISNNKNKLKQQNSLTQQLLRYKQTQDEYLIGRNQNNSKAPAKHYTNKYNNNKNFSKYNNNYNCQEDNYYQRFNYTPYQKNFQTHPNQTQRNQYQQQESQKYTSKQKQKRVCGSIVKRDYHIKSSSIQKPTIQNGKIRIDSFRSESKFNSLQNNIKRKRLQTDTDIKSLNYNNPYKNTQQVSSLEGRIGQRRQHKNSSKEKPKHQAKSKRRQVYLDLIGYEHSIESQNQSYSDENKVRVKQNYEQDQNNCKRIKEAFQEKKDQRKQSRGQRREIINRFTTAKTASEFNTQRATTTPTSLKSPFIANQINSLRNQLNNHEPSTLQKQKAYCKIHHQQEIIYYCLSCRTYVCSQCALYGEHKEHDIHTLKKAESKFRQTLCEMISQLGSFLLIEEKKQRRLQQQIKEIRIQCNKQKQKVKFAFENFIKNIQNKYAQILNQLEQSQSQALVSFEKELEKSQSKCQQFISTLKDMNRLYQTFSKDDKTQKPRVLIVNKFDDYFYFQQNSIDSVDKIAICQNNNGDYLQCQIHQLQQKLSRYDQLIKKIKLQYEHIIYPSPYLYNQPNLTNNNKIAQTNKLIEKHLFFKPKPKSHKQSQLHESLKLSETSLLIQPQTSNQHYQADDFLNQQDFIQDNNVNSLNLMIEKQDNMKEFSRAEEQFKLIHGGTIVDTIKEIQEIIKHFKIQFKYYHIKVGKQ